MAFLLKEDAQISIGGGTLQVTVINDETTSPTLGAESPYSINIDGIKASPYGSLPDAIVAIIKDQRGLGE